MAVLLSGGPAEGVVAHRTRDSGRVWTISIVHVNCACEWCAKVEGAAVEHVYERRDDVFAYRESRKPRERVEPCCPNCGAPNRAIIAVSEDGRCVDEEACAARVALGRPTHLITPEGVTDLRVARAYDDCCWIGDPCPIHNPPS